MSATTLIRQSDGEEEAPAPPPQAGSAGRWRRWPAVLGGAALLVVWGVSLRAWVRSPALLTDGVMGESSQDAFRSYDLPWRCHTWSAVDRAMHDQNMPGPKVCLRDRGDGLDYLWNSASLAGGCGRCWCCWREAAWGTYTGVQPLALAARGAAGAPRDAAQCEFSEPGFDYVGGEFSIVDRVLSSGACCAMCQNERACTAWTWSRREGQCQLKSQTLLRRTPSPDSVSGTSAAGRLAGRSFIVQSVGRACLHSIGVDRVPLVAACNANMSAQQWSYDFASRALQALDGGCLAAQRGRLTMAPCGAPGVDARWEYRSDLGSLQLVAAAQPGAPGLCLAAAAGVYLAQCESRPGMQWLLRRILAPPSPLIATFYMYRAQSDEEYPNENINTADLPGVLWYLQNEVLGPCPRKYNITRIRRLRVTLRKDQIVDFVAFDRARCTVPGCLSKLSVQGFRVGCQYTNYGGDAARWYSLPGACPDLPAESKNLQCLRAQPGGACNGPIGTAGCSYHVEDAGDVGLSELSGIRDFKAFCADGNVEYDKATQRGRGLDFWDLPGDQARSRLRQRQTLAAFARKYPNLPTDYDTPPCAK